MRKVKYFTFNDKDLFLSCCNEEFDIAHNNYNYYFCNLCNRINDIETLIKNKKDYHTHRCNVYYINDECYFVLYRKADIIVEVLLDCNGAQIAHKLVRDLEKKNITKEEVIEPW